MTYVSLAIILAILVGVIIFIARPFFSAETEEETPETTAPEMLGEEGYQDILKRIRELDFDFQLGKVSAEDHASLREELKQAAAEYLQREREDSVAEDAETE